MTNGLRHRIAVLVGDATEGGISMDEALADGASLQALGLTSLGLLRLIDAIESEFGVDIELSGGHSLDTVDDVVNQLQGRTGVRGVSR